MRAKIRLKVKRHEKTKESEIEKWDIGKVNKKQVKAEFINEVQKCTKYSSRRGGRYK